MSLRRQKIMKKTLNKKLSGSSRIVRGIFRPNSARTCECTLNNKPQNSQISIESEEADALREQVANLRAAVNSLRDETEKKEVVLANIARDKEKLTMDLLKVKRSNSNLAQQLEDERRFYYKEKETYCQEMNDFKKLKKVLKTSSLTPQIDNINNNNNNADELVTIKKKLEQTLHTNYNLSVKFLKMKDSKAKLNKSLKKSQQEHERIVDDLKMKIEILSTELNDVLDQNFQQPMSPSNKKYLQIVNQNSFLLYENLRLQSDLTTRQNRIHGTRSEAGTQTTTKVKKKTSRKQEPVITIFERDRRPGVPPSLKILCESEASSNKKRCNSDNKLHLPEINESKLTVFQVSELQSTTSTEDCAVDNKKRSRSAPKIVQSSSFERAKK